MGWSIWQSLKAPKQATSPRRDSVHSPALPSRKVLIEIFGSPSPPARPEPEAVESPRVLRKEA